MKRGQAIGCGVVALLGLVSFTLGIAAQCLRVKKSEVRYSVDGETCRYAGGSPASALGIIAGLCIISAQILANSLAGCACCRSRDTVISSSSAIMCLVISWILSVLSFLLLITAGIVNSSIPYKVVQFDHGLLHCPYPSSWPFPTGATLALIVTFLLIIYCVLGMPIDLEKEIHFAHNHNPSFSSIVEIGLDPLALETQYPLPLK